MGNPCHPLTILGQRAILGLMASGFYIKAFEPPGTTFPGTPPIGTITQYITDKAEDCLRFGFIPCDGKLYSPFTYPDLFWLIGYSHKLPQDGEPKVIGRDPFRVPWLDEYTGVKVTGCHHEWVE